MRRVFHVARHRAAVPVSRRSMPLAFEPRHCAGDSCLHNHAGGSRLLVGRIRNYPQPEAAPRPASLVLGRDPRLPSPTWPRRVS